MGKISSCRRDCTIFECAVQGLGKKKAKGSRVLGKRRGRKRREHHFLGRVRIEYVFRGASNSIVDGEGSDVFTDPRDEVQRLW